MNEKTNQNTDFYDEFRINQDQKYKPISFAEFKELIPQIKSLDDLLKHIEYIEDIENFVVPSVDELKHIIDNVNLEDPKFLRQFIPQEKIFKLIYRPKYPHNAELKNTHRMEIGFDPDKFQYVVIYPTFDDEEEELWFYSELYKSLKEEHFKILDKVLGLNLALSSLYVPFFSQTDEEDLRILKISYVRDSIREKISKVKHQRFLDNHNMYSFSSKFKYSFKTHINTVPTLKYWRENFNKFSFENELAGLLLLHCFVGQALSHKKIRVGFMQELDYRVHLLWIQDSGSGKSQALNFLQTILNHEKIFKYIKVEGNRIFKRRYTFASIGRITPSALLNSYMTDTKGKLKIDKKTGEPLINYGLLEGNDMLFNEEARLFLEGDNPTTKEFQEILMHAMETVGSFSNINSKKLTNYDKPCLTECSSSFVFVSRPIGKSIKETLIGSGMVQRMLFYPRSLSEQERNLMNNRALECNLLEEIKDEDSSYQALIENLDLITKFGITNEIHFNTEDKRKKEALTKKLLEIFSYFQDRIMVEIPIQEMRDLMFSIVSRYRNNILKIAFHSAVLRLSNEVTEYDLEYAFWIFKRLFDSQMVWIDSYVRFNSYSDSIQNRIYYLLKKLYVSEYKGKLIPLKEAKEYLSCNLNKTEKYIAVILNKLCKSKKYHITFVRLKAKSDGRKKYIKFYTPKNKQEEDS